MVVKPVVVMKLESVPETRAVNADVVMAEPIPPPMPPSVELGLASVVMVMVMVVLSPPEPAPGLAPVAVRATAPAALELPSEPPSAPEQY